MGRPWALNDDGKAQIIPLRKQGLGAKKISALTGYSRSVIQRWLREVEQTNSDEHQRWYQIAQTGQINDLPRARTIEEVADLQRDKDFQEPIKPSPAMAREMCWYCNKPIDGPLVQVRVGDYHVSMHDACRMEYGQSRRYQAQDDRDFDYLRH